MANAKLDRRVLRTRKALNAAFVKLVLSRGYEGLSADEICSEANVGRSTFYLHYANKEALLKESLKAVSTGLAACVDQTITLHQLTALLDHFQEQRVRCRTFFTDPIRSIWVKCLAATIEPRLKRTTRGTAARPIMPGSLVALWVAETQLALIAHWLNGRPALKSELIAAALLSNTRAML